MSDKEIVLDRFRLSSVVLDMTGSPIHWNVHGYFITKGEDGQEGRIFSNFTFSSIPEIKKIGGAYFKPNDKVHNLTELLLSEIHSDIENFIWEEFGGTEEKEDAGSEDKGESSQQEERQEVDQE